MAKVATPERCPVCGQPLVHKQAIAHYHRALPGFERRLRTEATKELRREIRAEYQDRLQSARLEAKNEARRELREQYEAKLKSARAAGKDDKRVRRLEALLERQRAESDRQRTENEKLRRQLEGLQPGDRGEFDEEDLKRRLEAAFKDKGDNVERVGRGRAGSDLIQTVRYQLADGGFATAGRIVYECKDRLDWKNEFLVQAKQARGSYKTPYVVLVVRTLPRKHRHFYVDDGIPVVQPEGALHVAEIIRRMAVEVHKAGLSGTDREQKTSELYEDLSGEEFQGTFADLIEVSTKLQTALQKERDWHEGVWARRESDYKELAKKSRSIDASIRAIIERPARTVGEKLVRLRA